MSVRRFHVFATLLTLLFSLNMPALEPSFLKVSTLAASDKAHDLLKTPAGVAVMRSTGDVIVADTSHHRILRISPAGAVSVLAGTGKPGLTDGPGAQAQFKQPSGVAVDDSRGMIYVADTGNHAIRSITFGALVATLAGPDEFRQPMGITVNAAGTIFIADTGNSRIRQVTPSGGVMTIAGDVHEGFADGAANVAQFKQPQGISVGPDGALYIADTKNNAIRKLIGGIVSTLAGTSHGGFVDGPGTVAEFKEPSGITCDESGNVYVADVKNHAIRRIAVNGSVTTVTGSGKAGFTDGGIATALFREPGGIAFAGALWIADSGNDAIRRIDAAVTITAIDPHTGAAAGGTQVHVFGSGFVPGATQVAFGTAPATNVAYASSTEILVTAPAVSGTVDVTVTTPGGSATLNNAYSTAPPPTLATINPRKGATAGGQAVSITGTNFTAGMTVKFGTIAATGVTITNSNSLTAVTPASSPGTVDVSAGTATKPGGFTYFAPPVITNFSPTQGAAGTVVTINGVNFDSNPAGDIVLFGTLPASVTASSQTQLVVTAPAGVTTGRITVTTAGGSATSSVNFTTATYASLEITAPVTAFGQGDAVPFNAIARLTDGSGTDVSAQTSWSTSDANVVRVASGLVAGQGVGGATITATFNGLTATKAVSIQPVTVPVAAPTAVNRTIVQPLADTIRFLYSGAGAVQTGVAPNAINDDRVSTVRGSVHTRGGAPIVGVEITIAGHPEFGHTFTRVDGRFDLAFNGGGTGTLVYRKASWLEARRLVTSLWNEQKVVDDVVLIPFDAKTNLVTMSNAAPQIARATEVSDGDGARTTTLIMPAGESATVTTPDGTVTTPSSLHLRATEYTIGDTGPKAMPAPLPPFSGYTYCVELSADEASGGSVQFSKPVSVYLENFLSFPAGTQIPLACYDHNRNSWIAARNGRVIRIIAITAGVAMIDTNGDGSADDDATLAALGFDDGERRTLATNYSAGQSLWRMRMNHFSIWDGNLSVAPPADAVGPKRPKPQTLKGKTQAKCQLSGWSIVDCANQTLGESIAIQGTPYSLEYDSSRAGQSAYSTEIELSGPSVPASMIRIELHITIAGQDHLFTFPPQPNLKYTYTWDGRDGFGRPIQGACNADITITYVYPMRYAPTSSDPGWNVPADAILAAERRAGNFKMSEGAQLFLGHFGAGDAGFGGWTFSGLRQYDGIGRVIYDGGGTERAADPQQTHETALATLTLGPPEDLDLFTMAPAPDGTLYFSDGYKIRKTSPDGITTDVAGTVHSGFTPDGFNALGNPLNLWQITTGPDGTLYVIDATRVRAIVNGRWSTIAGNDSYEQGEQPEGVPATSRSITAWSLAVGPDGAVYVGSLGHIYKIDPDGTIRTIAGIRSASGSLGDFVDGASAYAVPVGTIRALAVGPDGSVYFANGIMVGKVTPDGHLFHVMTTNPANNFYPNGVSVAEDGTVLVADVNGRRVWMIGPDGVPVSFAGTGEFQNEAVLPAIGMSRSFMLGSPLEAKIAADGSVVILDWWFEAIRHVGASFPSARIGTTVIPSPDGSLAYLFESGRHARTVDALTNVTLETFQYDAAGNLSGITDLDGLATQIERNGAGEPTAIVAPNGQRTTLAVSGGNLQSITEPGGAAYGFGYGSNGLLTSLTDRRGGLHKFTYDDDGLLSRDEDPAGGFISLTRTGIGNTFNVSRTSAEGRTNSYATAVDASGSEMHTHVGPDGLPTTSSFYAGNSSVSSSTGSVSESIAGDPRFGMLAPLPIVTTTNGSKSLHMTQTRSVTLSDPNNILSLASLVETSTVNDKSWTASYDAATRTITRLSPAGRQSSATLDAKGRTVLVQRPSLVDSTMTYDTRGRISSVALGSRSTTFAYDGSDQLTSVTDPLHRTVTFGYDAAGRVTSQTLPDGRVVGLAYDASGNVTSITPPSRPTHGFTFTPVDLTDQYTPPAVSNGGATSYRYNKDRQLTLITRADAQTIALDYDTAGRVARLSTSGTILNYGYDGAGRLASVSNSNGPSLTYTYDGSLLTAQTWTGEVSGSVGLTYDNDLRLASENGIAFSYDSDGLLIAAGALNLQRDTQTGFLTGTTLGSTSDAWTYNSFGEPMTHAVSIAGSEVLRDVYTRDDAGRITQIAESVDGTTTTTAYGYDAAGRLATVTHDSQPVASYAYDANGNRAGGTYDGQDRLLALGGTTYTYTNNGELATKTDGSGITAYTYDTLGNLRTVLLPDGKRIDYVIDAQSRRVGKKINGTLVAGWLYSGQIRIVAETDGTGAVTKRFVYGNRSNAPDYMLFNGLTYRIITDHLGSPRYILEASTGTLVASMSYDEFGNVLSDSNPGFQPFGFAGGLYDRETGLIRLGSRDYNPRAGRWTSEDPAGFNGGDSNLYNYVNGDPVNAIDPFGWMRLPADPSGLGPEWTLDPRHRDPNGQRFRDPEGNSLDFHQGRPGLTGWKGKNHWHYNEDDDHLQGGDEVPDPAQAKECAITMPQSLPDAMPSISIKPPNPCIVAFGLLGAAVGGVAGSVVPVAGNAAGVIAGFSLGGAIGGAAVGLIGGYIGCQ